MLQLIISKGMGPLPLLSWKNFSDSHGMYVSTIYFPLKPTYSESQGFFYVVIRNKKKKIMLYKYDRK